MKDALEELWAKGFAAGQERMRAKAAMLAEIPECCGNWIHDMRRGRVCCEHHIQPHAELAEEIRAIPLEAI